MSAVPLTRTTSMPNLSIKSAELTRSKSMPNLVIKKSVENICEQHLPLRVIQLLIPSLGSNLKAWEMDRGIGNLFEDRGRIQLVYIESNDDVTVKVRNYTNRSEMYRFAYKDCAPYDTWRSADLQYALLKTVLESWADSCARVIPCEMSLVLESK